MRLDLPQPYEDFCHTSDVGVVVKGHSAEEALARLVLAMASLLFEEGGLFTGAPREVLFTLEGGPDFAGSAVALLREVLYRALSSGEVPVHCDVSSVDDRSVTARVGFSNCDASHRRELKAVTRHQAKLAREGEQWIGRAVFDV